MSGSTFTFVVLALILAAWGVLAVVRSTADQRWAEVKASIAAHAEAEGWLDGIDGGYEGSDELTQTLQDYVVGISVFIVIVAALNLVLDFDFIETGVEQGAPKYMEWYAAFGLLVTLIWLYLEILRLLSKLRSR